MATDESFKEFIVEQAEGAGRLRANRMFGVYCLYCDDKPVAFICEDSVLVKETAGGRAYIGDPVEGELFPGSRLWFVIESQFEDRDWFSGLIHVTAAELLPPRPRKKRAKKYLINDDE
jgi:DNA transformation protein and related proteins